MSNTVTLKRSSVAGKIPQTSDLTYGEVALNFADGRLYFRNSNDQIEFFEKSAESGGFTVLEEDTDLGSVNDSNITLVLDAGSVNDSEESSTDLGFLAITGFINPGILTLPSYNSNSLPPVEPQSQVIYVSDNGTLAFSDGNNWNQFSEVATTGSYNDLSDTPAEGATTGKAIAMAIVFG